MSFKLIGMIFLLVIVTLFCGFNNGEGYRCNVNLLFHTFENVPVFLTALVAFLAGATVALPFTFVKRAKKQPKNAASKTPSFTKKALSALRPQKADKAADESAAPSASESKEPSPDAASASEPGAQSEPESASSADAPLL